MYRLAKVEDMQDIVALWQRVFGDEEAFIRRCLQRFVGEENVFVAVEESLAAILTAVPCRMDGEDGVYLYALATAPKKRGSGIMTGLMQYAEMAAARRGARFAALIPASPPLYAYYQQRGYDETVWLRHLEYTPQKGSFASKETDACDAERFAQLRKKYAKVPCLSFSRERWEEICTDLLSQGAQFAVSDKAYAVYFGGQEEVLVAELFAQSQREAENVLRMVAQKADSPNMHLTLAKNNPLFTGEGIGRPAALIKSLQEGRSWQNAYLRFAMDEVATGWI